MTKNCTLLIICFLIQSYAFCSHSTGDGEDKKITPALKKKLGIRSLSNDEDPVGPNAIKFNPLLVAVGDVGIYYERKLAKQFSAEVGVGFTTKNFLYDYYSQLSNVDQRNLERTYHTNYSLSGALKIYFNNIALDGFYISPEIRYRYYSMRTTCEDIEGIDVFEERDIKDLKIVMGVANTVGGTIIVDFFGGMGLRYANETIAHCEEEIDPITNTSTFSLTTKTKQRQLPTIWGGIKIGVVF